MRRTVIEGCAIATVDGERTEHPDGHIVIEEGWIVAVGPGPAPPGDDLRIDGRGCLATPGLVNCHHHLYQWATRGLAQEATLFEWLGELYPVWAHVDEEIERAAARAGLAALARSGCTTASDHHYVFPRRRGEPARDGDRGRPRDRPALSPLPRLDGPRPLRGRPSARRGDRGP